MNEELLFLIVFLVRTIECSEYCQAVDFMCKPKMVTKQTSKHIGRWLEKVKAMPDCFLGDERETVEDGDGSVEVMTLVGGVRSGVAVRFSSSDQRYLLSLTQYRDGNNVGPVWDLTMGRGYNATYHFHPRTATVHTNIQELNILIHLQEFYKLNC